MSAELLAPPAGRRRRVVEYPDGDGKPMAETAPHVWQIFYLLFTLDFWFRAREDVYVGANMFLYYQKGHPKKRIAPDVFVARGVPKEWRRSYKLWEEKQAPQVVFEITSPKTQEEDFGRKRLLYSRLGVTEYYLFDPYGKYLNPPLRGYKLVDEEYVPQAVETPAVPTSNGKEVTQGWRLTSEQLNLELWAMPTNQAKKPYILRLYDSATGEWLVEPSQALVEREVLKRKMREAEARAARLEAELEKLRGKGGADSPGLA
ncbi:MAG: Uma2 family endonuclease [bacterium]